VQHETNAISSTTKAGAATTVCPARSAAAQEPFRSTEPPSRQRHQHAPSQILGHPRGTLQLPNPEPRASCPGFFASSAAAVGLPRDHTRVLHPNGIPTFFERFSENPNNERSELLGNPNAAKRTHWAKAIAVLELYWDSPTLGSCSVGMIPGRNEVGERSEACGIPGQGEKSFWLTFSPSDVSNKLFRPTPYG
jgi:hypothetical protein